MRAESAPHKTRDPAVRTCCRFLYWIHRPYLLLAAISLAVAGLLVSTPAPPSAGSAADSVWVASPADWGAPEDERAEAGNGVREAMGKDRPSGTSD